MARSEVDLTGRGPIDAESFATMWHSPGFAEYVNDTARRFARNAEDQRDLKQEAACYLSLAVDGLTCREYRRIAYNAIRCLHRASRQERALSFETYFNYINRDPRLG